MLAVTLAAVGGGTLHSSDGNADGIVRTYAPDFGGAGIAGDWALRVGDGEDAVSGRVAPVW